MDLYTSPVGINCRGGGLSSNGLRRGSHGKVKLRAHTIMKLLNTSLREDATVVCALRAIYGVGLTQAKLLCGLHGVGADVRVIDFPSEAFVRRTRYLDREGQSFPAIHGDRFLVEKELRRAHWVDLEDLRLSGCYRGVRQLAGLPSHGQRTRTNGAKRLRVGKLKALQQKRLGKGKGRRSR